MSTAPLTPEPDARPAAAVELAVRDLGRVSYDRAYDIQKRLQQAVIDARATGGGPQHLLLVEHDPPVITISRRRGARRHLLADEGTLAAAGVELRETDRGGDVTYHGPGQLVAYAILDLNVLGLRLHGYLRLLEQVAIDVIDTFGVAGHRDPEATGVWVDRAGGGPGKICAIGVRVSRWVTMHGLALNVSTDLSHFDLIVPCGLAGRSVSSLAAELGEACPAMDRVKAVMEECFRERLGAR